MNTKINYLPLVVTTLVLSLTACSPGDAADTISNPNTRNETWGVSMSMSGSGALSKAAGFGGQSSCKLHAVQKGTAVQLLTGEERSCAIDNDTALTKQYIVFNGQEKLTLDRHEVADIGNGAAAPVYYTIKNKNNTPIAAVDVAIVEDTFDTKGYVTRTAYRCTLQDENLDYNSNNEYVLYYEKDNNFYNHRIDLDCKNPEQEGAEWKLSIYPVEKKIT